VLPNKLLKLVESEGIIIRWWKLMPSFLGLYYRRQGVPPFIALDYSLEQNPRLMRCVLAEELGHHFTSRDGIHLVRNRNDVLKRILISMTEFRALEWAANYLIPENDLDDAMSSAGHINFIKNLAEQFNVTEKMMLFRLELLEPEETRYMGEFY